MQHIGAIALLSNVRASLATDRPTSVAVPDPVADFSERPAFFSIHGRGRERRHRAGQAISGARLALHALQTGLDTVANQGTSDENLTTPAHDAATRGIDMLRNIGFNENRETILAGADIPPIIRNAKDAVADRSGRDRALLTWSDYFRTAPTEQLTNFAQWYTERLATLTNPDARAALTQQMKADYADRVEQGMAAGWIDDAHRQHLHNRLDRTDIRFFSPFGEMPEEAAGIAQQSKRPIVAMPTIAGTQILTHELGHVFAGVDKAAATQYVLDQMPDDQQVTRGSLDQLCTMINEGFNDHMTQALIDGEPTIVRPSERDRLGIVPTPGAPEPYVAYREAFGVLIGGPDGTITNQDLRQVVDSMVARDFRSFAAYAERRWNNPNVFPDVLSVIEQRRHEQLSRIDYDATSTTSLADRIAVRLSQGAPLHTSSV